MSDVKKIGPGKKVVFQSAGKVAVEPYSQQAPVSNEILVKTKASLISPGTEGACLSGKANWVSYPHYPGYSNAGDIIMSVGIKEYFVGQRIYSGVQHQSYGLIQGASDDAGTGQTEGFVSVDSTALIPEGVTYEQATFAALGAVALYGIRRAAIVPGESVVVVGLGIVGQLAVQLARLSGAMPVIGIDPLQYRRDLAECLGADETINSDSTWVEAVIKKVGGGQCGFGCDRSQSSPSAIHCRRRPERPGCFIGFCI